jgi:uncharacterized Zn-binding protein involved in type VI secretion
MDTMGGKILNCAPTVLAGNMPVGIHPSPLTPHPGSFPQITIMGSLTVFAGNLPVLRMTSPTACGHVIITGCPTVLVS